MNNVEKSQLRYEQRLKSVAHYETQKAYRHTEKGKAIKAASIKLWRSKNKEKINAHTAVRAALKKGTLHKPAACPECSKTSVKIEAHHADYTKPLEVTWACQSCHSLVHRGGSCLILK
jgi:uncharacterized protein with PIN domain